MNAPVSFKITPKNELVNFHRISDELMNNFQISAGNEEYRIAELEFYWHSTYHKDPYVHKNERQKTTSEWYFHGSGMDITFGNDESYGGILIRAISDINTGEYYYGPIVCVSKIFSTIGNVFNPSFELKIEPKKHKWERQEILMGPRVGLNPVHSQKFYEAPYRHLIFPKKKHAEKSRIFNALEKQFNDKSKARIIWA